MLMKKEYREAIEDSPVIAAVNSFESLECHNRGVNNHFGEIHTLDQTVLHLH